MVLAIETATAVCSVALGDTDGMIDERRETGKGIHSEKLFVFLEELMHAHQIGAEHLSAVLLSGGPGSYTGLRIGAAAVKGLLFQADIPLYILGTLESMAVRALLEKPGIQKIHAVIDARRKHLYHQVFFIQDEIIRRSEPALRSIEKLGEEIQPGDAVIGTGTDRLPEALQNTLDSEQLILNDSFISSVNLIHALNHSAFKNRFKEVNPEEYEPDYLSSGQVNDSDYPA